MKSPSPTDEALDEPEIHVHTAEPSNEFSLATGTEQRPTPRARRTADRDIELVRERIRAWLAGAVIALLFLALLAGLASGKLSGSDVKECQTALIALVGTAMGFYFGRPMK